MDFLRKELNCFRGPGSILYLVTIEPDQRESRRNSSFLKTLKSLFFPPAAGFCHTLDLVQKYENKGALAPARKENQIKKVKK